MKAIDYIRRTAFPCDEAKVWLEDYNYDVASAWKHCTRPDWMLWSLHNVEHRPTNVAVRAVLCDLAESYLEYLESKNVDVLIEYRDVIEKVRAWLARTRDTGVADYDALTIVANEADSYGRDDFSMARGMIVGLCASWNHWGGSRGSRDAANEFMFTLGDAIEFDELPMAVRKRMCRIIRAAVPVFPVVD
jgi:hypothetical protein